MPVCPFQKPLNELLSLWLLVGLVFGSADQARAQIVPLPTFGIEMDQTSISGLSSGGYMAVQFSVAFSALIKGVGVIAGGPYYCAQGDIGKATALCTCTSLFCGFYPESIDVAALIRTTDESARRGRIDPTSNLAQQRIWLFSGKSDSIVPPRVMDALDAYFAHYVEKSRISYNRDVDAQHAMPTDSYGNPCDDLGDPYINKAPMMPPVSYSGPYTARSTREMTARLAVSSFISTRGNSCPIPLRTAWTIRAGSTYLRHAVRIRVGCTSRCTAAGNTRATVTFSSVPGL